MARPVDRSAESRSPRNPLRLGAAVLALAAIGVLATTWLSSTERADRSLATGDLLVVNDAGPVRIRALDQLEVEPGDPAPAGVVVRTSSSWLLRAPVIEVVERDGTAAVRVRCQTRLPCRSAVEIFAPSSMAISVVAAEHQVQVDRFDGALSIFAGDGGVALGSVQGSVSVVSGGPVVGRSLGPSQLTVDVVDDDVSLTYLDSPTVLSVVGGEGSVEIDVPSTDYFVDAVSPASTIEIDSDPESERRITVRSDGAVSIRPTSGSG